jgi:hypothetical protein
VGQNKLPKWATSECQNQLFAFEGELLSEAILRTFERRKTALPVTASPTVFTSEFFDDEAKKNQWNAFINKNRLYVPAISLQEAVADIERFVMPLIAPTQEEGQRVRTWPPGGPWSKNTVEQG